MSINRDQYTPQVLANRAASIPMVDPSIRHTNSVTTPEWMISIDDLLSSTIEGFEDCSELYGWFAEQGRLTKGRSGNQLFSTAAVQHSNVLIVLPAGIFIPTLETKMNTGSNLALIKIVRLANMTDLKVSLQEIEYTNCLIDSMEQQLDNIVISFRPETRQNTIFKYKQDGSKEGQAVSKFDYTTGAGE
jgi:hypothetical protein